MKPKDGGAAFPRASDALNAEVQKGMSLRDYFAAKAMQGMLTTWKLGDKEVTADDWAAWAYETADAMLKAREKEPKNA